MKKTVTIDHNGKSENRHKTRSSKFFLFFHVYEFVCVCKIIVFERDQWWKQMTMEKFILFLLTLV